MNSKASQKFSLGAIPTIILIVSLILLFAAERVLGEGAVRRTLLGLGGAGLVLALVFRVQILLSLRKVDSTVDLSGARKAERNLLLATVGVIIGLLLYVLSSGWGLDLMGLRGDARERVEGVLLALWPAVTITSLFALIFMEVAYRKMPILAAVEQRRITMAAQAGLGLALALVFLFSINYVVSQKDIKRDLSYFKTTRPSETSTKLVERLGEPMQVVLFYREGDDVLPRVKPYFDDLAEHSKNLKVSVIDHALAPKFARDQKVQDNGHVLLLRGEKTDKNAQTERFEIGTDLEDARPKLRTLDATFQERFAKMTQPERSLHLTVGHGERNSKDREGYGQGDGVEAMQTLLKRFNIKSNELGMAQGLGSQVPEGAGAVAVVGPREAFVKEEAESLLRYVRGGGRLMLLLDPDTDVGLEPLLTGLGLELLPGMAVSEQFHMRRTFKEADRGFIFSKDYSSHPSVTTASRLAREIATVFVEGGALANSDAKVSPDPKVTFPLRTPTQFWRDLNGNYERDGEEKFERLNLMAAVTVPNQGGREGRAVVIADGDFITDKVIGNKGNLFPFVDSLRWLIGEEELSGDLTSEEDVRIEHSKEEDKPWFYLTTFALPMPIIFLGVWISARRRRRNRGAS